MNIKALNVLADGLCTISKSSRFMRSKRIDCGTRLFKIEISFGRKTEQSLCRKYLLRIFVPHSLNNVFFFVFQLIQQELNIDGMLDINIPISTQYAGSHLNSTQNSTIATLGLPQDLEPTKLHSVQTSTQSGVKSSPSWVH